MRPGEPLPEGFWSDPGLSAGYQKNESSVLHLWPIPINASGRSAKLEDDGTLTQTTFAWNDVGIPFPLLILPVRIRTKTYHYAPGRLEPVSSNSFDWNLLYARTRNGQSKDPDALPRASGVPLLFSRISIEIADAAGFPYDANAWATLWTLGPAAIRFTSRGSAQASRGESGRITVPLLLGGPIGPLLWMDVKFGSGKSGYVAAHGPLLGFLGYQHYHSPMQTNSLGSDDSDDRVDLTRRVALLSGFLWEDIVRRNREDGSLAHSRHGILWSAFGWGHRKERFQLRVLYVPITF